VETRTDLDDGEKRELWPWHESNAIIKFVLTIILVKHGERKSRTNAAEMKLMMKGKQNIEKRDNVTALTLGGTKLI